MDNEIYNHEIKVVMADDHEVVRNGIKRLFILDKKITIIGEASNGADAVDLVRYHKPDIALLDIFMPKMNGIEATEIIKDEMPEVLVVMLTAYEDSTHLESALSAGADGYLTKDITAKNLVESIHKVVLGERVYSQSILHLVQKRTPTAHTDSTPVGITVREQEILNLVAEGKSSPEIAEILNISFRTVQTHRQNIMDKLGVKNAAGLIKYAFSNIRTT